MIVWVYAELPDAILVNTYTASNCNEGLSSLSRHFTRIGKIQGFIRSSPGGFLSLDKSFLEKKYEKLTAITFKLWTKVTMYYL